MRNSPWRSSFTHTHEKAPVLAATDRSEPRNLVLSLKARGLPPLLLLRGIDGGVRRVACSIRPLPRTCMCLRKSVLER